MSPGTVLTKKLLSLTMAALFFLSSFPVSLQAKTVEMRNITVGVAVSPEYMAIDNWKGKFKRRLGYASKIFETEFKIRFKKTVFWTWEPPDNRMGMDQLLDDIMQKYSLKKRKVDIIIGLTRLDELKPGQPIQDLHVLGNARPFSGYMVIRFPDDPLYKIQEETVLTHELGHLFGAIHTRDAATVMAPAVDKQIPTAFDSENREIMQKTRTVNFHAGTQALNIDTVQRLVGSYVKYMNSKQPFDFYYTLSQLYKKMGQSESALKALKAAVDEYPDHAYVQLELGDMQAELGNWRESAKAYQTAASLLNGPGDEMKRAYTFNKLGIMKFREGSMNEAYHAWSRAATLSPKNASIKMNLALVQLERGQLDFAVKEFTDLLSSERSAKLLSYLGTAYFRKGNYQTAAKYLNESLAEQKKTGEDFGTFSEADIHMQLGSAYIQMKNNASALQHMGKACDLKPGAGCYKNIGTLYYSMQEWENAAKMLSRALMDDKEDPDIYGILGVSLSRMGQKQQAVGIFQEGTKHIKDKRQSAKLFVNMGNLYLQAEQGQNAMVAFQSAVANDWSSEEAHYGLGISLLSQGRTMEARQSFTNVLRINPSRQDVRELMEKTAPQIQVSGQARVPT